MRGSALMGPPVLMNAADNVALMEQRHE